MVELIFNRQQALWGEEGQKIIHDSSVAVLGMDTLGIEIVKSLVTLGVNNIYLFDNKRNSIKDFFIDIKLKGGLSKVESISDLVKRCFRSDCNITHYHTEPTRSFLNLNTLDAIIDTTNNPYDHYMCLDVADEAKAAAFIACADTYQGEFSFYHPKYKNRCEPVIQGFYGEYQGSIISSLLCGMIVEEVRKYIFKKNIKKFKTLIKREIQDPEEEQKNRGQWFEDYDYKDTVNKENMMNRNFYFALTGKTSSDMLKKDSKNKGKVRHEFEVGNPRILVLGAGAIGNYCTQLLTKIDQATVHYVDFDRYEQHNIQRQYYGYDRCNGSGGHGDFKADVLADKIKVINPTIQSQGIIGFVGEKYDDVVLQKNRLSRNEVKLVNRDFLSRNNYDIVLGCFDNLRARHHIAGMVSDLKIPYLDGASGTEPTRAALNIYMPSRNDECIQHRFSNLTDKQALRDKRWQDYVKYLNDNNISGVNAFIQGNSCSSFNAGSVSMGNQIASALMVESMRRILNPEKYGRCIIREAKYLSGCTNPLGIIEATRDDRDKT